MKFDYKNALYRGEEYADEGIAPIADVGCVIISLTIIILYHVWYYSWRFSKVFQVDGYHRVDITGQRAREIFVRSVVMLPTSGSPEASSNIALQATRNPITAVSILATGTTVGATTLVGILLDAQKMEQVRALCRFDFLTGKSSLILPEMKLACAIGVLFLSFFSLAQSLRLFIHFSFFSRAAQWCQMHQDSYGAETIETMYADACKTCLRAQTYMSIGFRFMYCFIPVVIWLMGGTYLVIASIATVFSLYHLDLI